MIAGAAKRVRCAIYTRKSSDEGLEQDFNSLDAQRESCAAYIRSQASEGWIELPDLYDDGGISGGTLARPALQRLLGEIRAGRVDIIVVYKVDRLTRSLIDFAKLVEAFDTAGTSFVSVTQSFNTTTSMGRLTLNMLLSFAQFEREVTAERIRDKIAASKAKGMWMGGVPPLGYRPDGRTLAIDEDHATIVRDLYRRYLELGTVSLLADALHHEGVTTPQRTTATGKTFGDAQYSRGQLYKLLANPVYVGDIAHRDVVYPGRHPAIIDRETWEAVQVQLAAHVKGTRTTRAASRSLLAGKLVDASDEPLIAVHATKGKVRYRYYVSKALQHQSGGVGLRIPASEIEAAVVQRIAALLADPLTLIASAWLDVTPGDIAAFTSRCAEVSAAIMTRDRGPLGALLTRVRVHDSRIEIDCATAAIAAALGVDADRDAPSTTALVADVRLTRSGRAMRLVHNTGLAVTRVPDHQLVRLIVKAQRWWARMRSDGIDVTTLAAEEGVTPSYLTRVLRLAFLAPSVVDAILAGTQRTGVDAAALTASGAIAADWRNQAATWLAGGGQRNGAL